MAITLFGSVSVPTDPGTNAASPTAFANPPIASMTTGDLVFVWAWSRTASSTIAVSNAGGQTWNSFTSQSSANATLSVNAFWCRFNGTWSAAPSFSFSGTLNNTNVYMIVFRPTNTSCTWAVSTAKTGVFTDKVAAATFTITGWTNTQPGNNVNIGVWCTDDDNTWGTLSGTNWVKTSLAAQIRNTSGSDSSASFAYQIQSAPAATNNVSQTETALGNDGGFNFAIAFVETDPILLAAVTASADRNIEQPYFARDIIAPTGMFKGIPQFNTDIPLNNQNTIDFINASGVPYISDSLPYAGGVLWSALDTLESSLRSNSLWTKMTAIYPFVGGTASTCKWNFKDPRDLDAAFRLSWSDTSKFTFASTGVIRNAFDGGYANTHMSSASGTSGHVSFYSRNDGTSQSNLFGASHFVTGEGTYNCYVSINGLTSPKSLSHQWGGTGDLSSNIAADSEQGYFVVSRRASNDFEAYRNATTLSSSSSDNSPSTMPGIDFYLFNRNGDGSPSDVFSGGGLECAFATIGTGLTDTDVTNLNTIVEAFNDTLGRGVQ